METSQPSLHFPDSGGHGMKDLEHGESGATAVEYGLLVALIAAVIIATVIVFGGKVTGLFESVCNASGAFSC
ncbi:Flp family type IVb pilin [Nocardioides cavernaquae]|nr:Flp family type IVb pilin [Nocardioides cavernaquae]